MSDDNKLKKILIVFGTRPEAIKMAPLIGVLKNKFNLSICVTGQHREMLHQVLDIFKIEPNYDLDVMKSSQDLFNLTSKVLLGMENVLINEDPDLVLVHGDTTTAMATTLAAFYKQIPIGHVEAGLRTNNVYSPFPEEVNRQIIGRLATFHFVPTELCRQNLLNESIDHKNITVTGNTVVDAIIQIIKKSRKTSFSKTLISKLPFLYNYKNESGPIILVTGHRRENFGSGFYEICKALESIAHTYPNVKIVYPVHLNPNVHKPVNDTLSNIRNIYLINPLNYIEFVKLMDLSYLILTDSGGIQEEAITLQKPVLVMRETTERSEALDAGTTKLVGTDRKSISNSVDLLLNNKAVYEKMSKASNPYGDGTASNKILS